MKAKVNYAQALVAFGERLYGEHWQGPMSRALGVHKNTVSRIAGRASQGQDYPRAAQLVAQLEAVLAEIVRELRPLAHAAVVDAPRVTVWRPLAKQLGWRWSKAHAGWVNEHQMDGRGGLIIADDPESACSVSGVASLQEALERLA